jgi:hypothetical protein
MSHHHLHIGIKFQRVLMNRFNVTRDVIVYTRNAVAFRVNKYWYLINFAPNRIEYLTRN